MIRLKQFIKKGETKEFKLIQIKIKFIVQMKKINKINRTKYLISDYNYNLF